MVIVDDILLFPMRGLLFVFQEIHKAVQQEFKNEAEAIRGELSRLYLLLESGQLTEAQFDESEKKLLDRLDELEGYRGETEDQAEDAEELQESGISD